MKRTRNWILAAAVAAFSAVTMTAQAQDVPGVTDDRILIGSFGSIAHPTYLYGKLPMNGVEAVFRKVNEAGGVHGRKLELVREDDRCDPATAIGAVKRLVYEYEVFAIIGGGCSNATLGAKSEIVDTGIPFVVFASVADPISYPVEPNIFTTSLTASVESKAQLDFALNRGAERIALVAQRDAWGQARLDPLMEELDKRGIELVLEEEMTVDQNDATAQALKIREADVDAVILVVYAKPAALLVRALNGMGVKPLLIGQSGITDPVEFSEQVGIEGATDKFYTINQVRYAPTDPEVSEWASLIEEMFPQDRLSAYNLFGVGAAKVAVEALERAGPDLTQEKFIEAMNTIRDFDAQVYGGPITCTPENHQCNQSPAWLKVEDGKAVVVDAK